MKLVIMQPSYLPWMGYFDLLLQSDMFLVYDNVQFDKDGWRNRNRIKTPNGPQWLTVPVLTKGMNKPTNREIRINPAEPWQRKHLKSLEMNYRKSPYFGEIYPMMEALLLPQRELLIDLNIDGIKKICDYLEIHTPIQFVSDLKLDLPEDRNGKLIEISCHMKADEFYEPEGGRNYMDTERFAKQGVKVIFQDFKHPVYPQGYGDFVSNLSIVDLLFNCGKGSIDVLKPALETSKRPN